MSHRAQLGCALLLAAATPLWARPGGAPRALATAVDSTAVALPLGAEADSTLPLRDNRYFYSSFGMSDPFRALVGGDFQPYEGFVDLQAVKLVGVLWEKDEYLGIVQDAQGYGYNLRPGDPVRNGVVVSVTRTELVGRVTAFGHTERITLRLKREE